MNDFLDPKYEVPQKSSNYARLLDGENKFRILNSPIQGWEYWQTSPEGARKPIRKRMGETISVNDLEPNEQLKHFWAMPVYNYKEEKVQILEITQKGIQKALTALSRSKDWGSPLNYDILITRSGQKLDTEYVVQPSPPKPLDPAIFQLYKDMKIDIEQLYSGGDPFKLEDLSNIDLDK